MEVDGPWLPGFRCISTISLPRASTEPLSISSTQGLYLQPNTMCQLPLWVWLFAVKSPTKALLFTIWLHSWQPAPWSPWTWHQGCWWEVWVVVLLLLVTYRPQSLNLMKATDFAVAGTQLLSCRCRVVKEPYGEWKPHSVPFKVLIITRLKLWGEPCCHST